METLQEKINSMTVVMVNMKSLNNDATSWSELENDSSFHQADLTEIQVIIRTSRDKIEESSIGSLT